MTLEGLRSTSKAAETDSTGTSASGTGSTAKPDALANKDTFLQLLVAQLRNQNPLQPADGVQFLSQLAQFSSVEQTVGMREEMTRMNATLDQIAKQLEPATKP